MSNRFSLGVDVGGTFTDACLVDSETGEIVTAKVSTTPEDRTRGYLEAVRLVLQKAGARESDVARLVHGSTVATNAILEGSGSRTALVTTLGFRYVLEIGRHDVPRSANPYLWSKPVRPIIPSMIAEVDERIASSGDVVRPLTDNAIDRLVEWVAQSGAEAVAVCLVNAYTNGVHEERIRAALVAKFPSLPVTVSSKVLPVFREYERTMATALNGYVLPVFGSYVAKSEEELRRAGVDARPLYMQSNGGVTSGFTAANEPIRMVLSGPAGGVAAASAIGSASGYPDIISIDIGGTSADVGIVVAGEPRMTTNGSVGPWPIPLPMTDIETVGAGGGSIASITENGSLVVGPRSAGAVPGPAAYGLGGTEPTVTDANLVLGYLDESLVSGEVRLSRALAVQAIENGVASKLGVDVVTAALGIVRMANNNMVGAIRRASVERGLDPRSFALMALGGGGGLHACMLAELLGVRTVLVPKNSGVLSAYGLVTSDLKNQFAASYVQSASEYDLAAIAAVYERLEGQATEWLTDEGVPLDARTIARSADLRYENQGFELTVEFPSTDLNARTFQHLLDLFHATHKELYTFNFPENRVELITLRVEARGVSLQAPSTPGTSRGAECLGNKQEEERTVHLHASQSTTVRIVDWAGISSGWSHLGPLVVRAPHTSVLVLPGWRAMVDPSGELVLVKCDAEGN